MHLIFMVHLPLSFSLILYLDFTIFKLWKILGTFIWKKLIFRITVWLCHILCILYIVCQIWCIWISDKPFYLVYCCSLLMLLHLITATYQRCSLLIHIISHGFKYYLNFVVYNIKLKVLILCNFWELLISFCSVD